MLFRTVYGAELEAIYDSIQRQTLAHGAVRLTNIYQAFVVSKADIPHESQHVDDALSFLTSALLIDINEGRAKSLSTVSDFRLRLLQNLRHLELGDVESLHPLDPYYMHLLTEIFIKTGRQFVRDLHTEANNLEPIKSAGGISREKIQAWKRVMTFLGVGYRAFNGFLCVYSPDLLQSILRDWHEESATLQAFLEDHVERYLPTTTRAGEIMQSFGSPLRKLAEQGLINLCPLQDSPSKAYFGSSQYKGIRKQTAHV